jgi:hypothetical protein
VIQTEVSALGGTDRYIMPNGGTKQFFTGTIAVSASSVMSADFQSKMLLMLNDTFLKLSTVISDSKNNSKSE